MSIHSLFYFFFLIPLKKKKKKLKTNNDGKTSSHIHLSKFLLLGTFLLEYCFMHPDLEPFVIAQLAGVLASLTRFGWADMEEYRNIHKDIQQFLQVIF